MTRPTTTTNAILEDSSSTDDDSDDGGGKLPPAENNVLALHHQYLAQQADEMVMGGTGSTDDRCVAPAASVPGEGNVDDTGGTTSFARCTTVHGRVTTIRAVAPARTAASGRAAVSGRVVPTAPVPTVPAGRATAPTGNNTDTNNNNNDATTPTTTSTNSQVQRRENRLTSNGNFSSINHQLAMARLREEVRGREQNNNRHSSSNTTTTVNMTPVLCCALFWRTTGPNFILYGTFSYKHFQFQESIMAIGKGWVVLKKNQVEVKLVFKTCLPPSYKSY